MSRSLVVYVHARLLNLIECTGWGGLGSAALTAVFGPLHMCAGQATVQAVPPACVYCGISFSKSVRLWQTRSTHVH